MYINSCQLLCFPVENLSSKAHIRNTNCWVSGSWKGWQPRQFGGYHAFEALETLRHCEYPLGCKIPRNISGNSRFISGLIKYFLGWKSGRGCWIAKSGRYGSTLCLEAISWLRGTVGIRTVILTGVSIKFKTSFNHSSTETAYHSNLVQNTRPEPSAWDHYWLCGSLTLPPTLLCQSSSLEHLHHRTICVNGTSWALNFYLV